MPSRGFSHLERVETDRTSTFSRAAGVFGAGLFTIAVVFARHVVSIDRIVGMDADGLNLLARNFSVGELNTALEIFFILTAFIGGVALTLPQLTMMRLLRWIGMVDDQAAAGVLGGVVRPRTELDTPRSLADAAGAAVYTFTITGIAADARAGFTLINWMASAAAVCIYGAFTLMVMQLFFFVRVDIVDGLPTVYINYLGKFVSLIFLLANLCNFTMQAAYNIMFMQRQHQIECPGDVLPFDSNAEIFRGFGPDQECRRCEVLGVVQNRIANGALNAGADDDDDGEAFAAEYEPVSAPLVGDGSNLRAFRYVRAPLGSRSVFLDGWKRKFKSLSTRVRRHRRHFFGERADRERADWSMRLAAVAAFFVAGVFTFAGCLAALTAIFLGINVVFKRIQKLQRGGPLPKDGPFWLVIWIHLPRAIFGQLPPVALRHVHRPFYVLFTASLAYQLGALVSIRPTPIYLLIVLVDTLHHVWKLRIPDNYVTADGRFDLGRVEIHEPEPRRIMWLLWSYWGWIWINWPSLLCGFAYVSALYRDDGTLVADSVASRRSATFTPAPAPPQRILIHTTAASYANPPLVAPGVVHVLDIRLLFPRLRHLSHRDLWDKMKAL